MRTLLLIMPFILAQVACDEIVLTEPAPADLAGTYHLTQSSRDFLLHRKDYADLPDSSVELTANMTIDIRGLPDCADDGLGRSGGRFLSGHGKWELRKGFLGYGLDLRLNEGGTLRWRYYGSWIRLGRPSPPHSLLFTVGDPDSGEALEYAKEAG